MKHLMCISTLLASSFAIAGQPIQIVGVGSTVDLAKINGIRLASERYCGTNILSDRVYKDYNTAYNQVTLYNSCFLQNYKVLSISQIDGNYSVSLELTLRPSNQSRRLNIRTSSDNQLNGNEADFIINQVKEKDAEAIAHLKNFLNDYPYNAYSIVDNVDEPYFKYDKRIDKTSLIIPYAFKGNKNYFEALETTLLEFGTKRTYMKEIFKTDNIGRPLTNFDEVDKQVSVNKTKIVIRDRSYYNFITDTITSKHPVLKVEIYNTQGNLVSTVYTELLHSVRLPALGGNLKLNYSVNNTVQYLYAGDTNLRKFQIELDLSNLNVVAKDLGSVQTFIIARNDCSCERFISSKTYN